MSHNVPSLALPGHPQSYEPLLKGSHLQDVEPLTVFSMTLTLQVPGIQQKAQESTEQTCVEPTARERQRRCLAEVGYQDQAGSHEGAQHDPCRRSSEPMSSLPIICPSVRCHPMSPTTRLRFLKQRFLEGKAVSC